MHEHNRWKLWLCAAVASGALMAVDAMAADAAAPAEASTDTMEMADIVVTAQRRSESLERTPVAVSVLGADALVKQAVVTESDLQLASPGVTVRASQNSNQINYAIRGQTLDAFSATRPSVLPYVDEIQIGGAGGSSAFYDLASIQVLKGPQGTLFGRNAVGGAVLITTQKPENEFGGYIDGSLGNYGAEHVEGAINLPLIPDRLLLRVAGYYQYHYGYQVNTAQDGSRVGTVNRQGVRGSLTFKIADHFKNDLVVDFLHSGGSSLSGVLYSLDPQGVLPLIALTNTSPAGAPTMEAIIGAFVGNPAAGVGAAAAYNAAHPNLDHGGLVSFLQTQQAVGPYRIAVDGPEGYKANSLIVSNATTYDLAANTQIKNVVGVTSIRTLTLGDIDGTPYGIDSNGTDGRVENTQQFSEELQLNGKVIDNQLVYVTGVFISPEKDTNLTTSALLQFPLIASTQYNNSLLRNKTYAGYAQGTYDLSKLTGVDGLGFTAGARYTNETISLRTLPRDISFTRPPAVLATYDFYQKKSYNNTSWTVGPQWQVNPNLLVYLTSRRSYRNGGYNNVVAPTPGLGNVGGNGYDVETVTDGELGAKYQGRLGNMPFRLNLALYDSWIKNPQQVAYTLVAGAPAAITVNVPKAQVKGVELDSQISLTSWLNVGLAANYTDARFTDNKVSVNGGAPVTFGTYPDTPKWSGSAFAEFTAPISADLSASFRTDTYTQTSTYSSSTGNLDPGTQLPQYTSVNFRIALADSREGWTVSASLKNAFNRVYYVGGVALGELFQTNSAVPGDPRTFFVEGRYKF